ncbi:hypothetical protein ABEF92_003152 [Exophiala dermatitidis]|uniref:Uncharacterized protein n=1 Tax=Exophiala dermatitidis (strain ATCC 34100 / CBS 525.76 / NIH/UT8656) TaxID=858893 RepID=H6BR29_EXODN|nr:uncharacterized protein HMPREF1120_02831 [Exophiala dermatitidis NIH/UT8656]EHY54664.1 hypothetical protein HMPREF1120_02831 [Exophiala dermatitidis NIH/UT8656]
MGRPHRHGMTVAEPPVCSGCRVEPESLKKLEQHVRKVPDLYPGNEQTTAKAPAGLLDGDGSRISLTHPLSAQANEIGPSQDNDVYRPMPPWMSLLPSVRKSRNGQPEEQHQEQCERSAGERQRFRRRSTFPSVDATNSSTPFATPPQHPVADVLDLPTMSHGWDGTTALSLSRSLLDSSQPSKESFTSALSKQPSVSGSSSSSATEDRNLSNQAITSSDNKDLVPPLSLHPQPFDEATSPFPQINHRQSPFVMSRPDQAPSQFPSIQLKPITPIYRRRYSSRRQSTTSTTAPAGLTIPDPTVNASASTPKLRPFGLSNNVPIPTPRTSISALARDKNQIPVSTGTKVAPPPPSPFYKELSGFFATRAARGKYILPSRVGGEKRAR